MYSEPEVNTARNPKKALRANSGLMLITAMWGLSFPLTKNALDYLDPWAFIAIRFVGGFLLLTALFYKRLIGIDRKTLTHGVCLGLLLFGAMAFQTVGMRTTSASDSAFITGFCVILVPTLSFFLMKKRPGLHVWAGVMLGLAGLALISGANTLLLSAGDLLTLMCALLFALQILFLDIFTQGKDAVALATIQIGTCGAMGAAVWAVTGMTPVVFNSTSIVSLALTTLLCTVINYTAQAYLQRDTTPVIAALIYNLEPVFGLCFALIIPNAFGLVETVGWPKLAGCVLMLSGMVCGILGKG